MRYCSTRGKAPSLEFSDVLLTGLARDGGLYVPEEWPQFSSDEIAGFSGLSYCDIAAELIAPFVGDSIGKENLRKMINQAYGAFSDPAVTPIKELNPNEFIVELFHGPTLAFKDIAMQLLGLLMDHVLEQRGMRATIVGATSGDTGGAAIDAFKHKRRTDMFILFPNERVSDVQRRQMTTVSDRFSHALAINGTFDDCQSIVKGLFNNLEFRDRVNLAGVNSINWSRIMAQVVYYFVAGVAVGAPHRKISFTVPTGNFGDIYAGFVAAKMGLPVERLIIATNSNDILCRALDNGLYEMKGVVATSSPSMDIQVSSNFERLMFDATGRDGESVSRMMENLNASGKFEIGSKEMEFIRSFFSAGRVSEQACAATIKSTWLESEYLLDPHTAVALNVARQQETANNTAKIVLATAHPAKFPDSVEDACGIRPELPDKLSDIMSRQENFSVLNAEQAEVEEHILSSARSVEERRLDERREV